jgi:hypothetical protein
MSDCKGVISKSNHPLQTPSTVTNTRNSINKFTNKAAANNSESCMAEKKLRLSLNAQKFILHEKFMLS